MSKEYKQGDLRVWWCPQVTCKAFHTDVSSTSEAKMVLAVLANYDIFQLEQNIKPDYCNAGGLECFQQYGAPTVEGDFPDWCEWESDDYEDIDDYEVPA